MLVQYVNVLATKPDDLSSDPRACMVKEETYIPELSFGVFMHIDFFLGGRSVLIFSHLKRNDSLSTRTGHCEPKWLPCL